MNIKGSSLNSTYNFVKNTFPERLDEWIQELPQTSRDLYSKTILATHWYPIQEAMIVPTKIVAKMFYFGDEKKASYKIGEYSADEGLKGVYKVFIKIATPLYVLQRSPRIFKTYYDKIEAEIIESENKHAIFYIKGIKEDEQLIFDRISGWIYKILELIKAKPTEVKYMTIPLGNGYIDSKIIVKWQ